MKLKVIKGDPLKLKTPCLVLGVLEGKLKEPVLQQLDQALDGAFSRSVRSREFAGEKGQALLLHGAKGMHAERVLLLGLGKERSLSLADLRQAASNAAKQLAEKQLDSFLLALTRVAVKKSSLGERAQAVAEGVFLADYRYLRYLPNKKPGQPVALDKVGLQIGPEESLKDADKGLADARAICAGVCFARDLVNDPGNRKSPEYLAMESVKMAERVGIRCHLLRREQLEKQGFGAMLGVAQGSEREPYLIVLEYSGGTEDTRPVALVGKGVVFDAGGISLKPAEKMDEMKMDMAGGAAVLGTMLAVAELQLPVNLVAVVPAVENMPSGTAIRPGDILTSLSGKTIEVLNTDAEGRLILADALTYVGRYQPRVVIDLATLTGACIVALGNQAAAVLGNHEGLVRQLLKAGERSGENLGQLPLWEEYTAQIKGDFADLKNTGGRAAGTITAAAFLHQFAEDYVWAHLDIAGMAWDEKGRPGQAKGGTGFGVRALIEYLRGEAK